MRTQWSKDDGQVYCTFCSEAASRAVDKERHTEKTSRARPLRAFDSYSQQLVCLTQ